MSTPPKPSNFGPQIFTLLHLEVGLVVFSCRLATAFAIFSVEYASRQLMKLWRSCLAAFIVRELLTAEPREKCSVFPVKVKTKKAKSLEKPKTLLKCLTNRRSKPKPEAAQTVKPTGKILKKAQESPGLYTHIFFLSLNSDANRAVSFCFVFITKFRKFIQ
jgi:hypothetical protein